MAEATKSAFGKYVVDPTPHDAPAPLFQLSECVSGVSVDNIVSGGVIRAVAWSNANANKSYVYKLGRDETTDVLDPGVYREMRLTTSKYGVGYLVEVKAFGTTSRCTIEKVNFVSRATGFSYNIGGGFVAREEDIVKLIARPA